MAKEIEGIKPTNPETRGTSQETQEILLMARETEETRVTSQETRETLLTLKETVREASVESLLWTLDSAPPLQEEFMMVLLSTTPGSSPQEALEASERTQDAQEPLARTTTPAPAIWLREALLRQEACPLTTR